LISLKIILNKKLKYSLYSICHLLTSSFDNTQKAFIRLLISSFIRAFFCGGWGLVVWDFGLFEWGGVRWGSIELKGDSCLVLRMTRGGAGMMR